MPLGRTQTDQKGTPFSFDDHRTGERLSLANLRRNGVSFNIPSLLDYLAKHPEITILDLSNCDLDPKEVRVLAARLQSVQVLLLANNPSAFRTNPLAEDKTTGFRSIEALAANPNFATLDLSHNELANTHTNLLKKSKQLVTLNISHNKIDHYSVLDFVEMKSLKNLDVSHNKKLGLVEPTNRDWEKSTSLQKVDIEGVNITGPKADQISEMCLRNVRLQGQLIVQNRINDQRILNVQLILSFLLLLLFILFFPSATESLFKSPLTDMNDFWRTAVGVGMFVTGLLLIPISYLFYRKMASQKKAESSAQADAQYAEWTRGKNEKALKAAAAKTVTRESKTAYERGFAQGKDEGVKGLLNASNPLAAEGSFSMASADSKAETVLDGQEEDPTTTPRSSNSQAQLLSDSMRSTLRAHPQEEVVEESLSHSAV